MDFYIRNRRPVLVPLIIFINTLVLFLWMSTGSTEGPSSTMVSNFLVSWNGLLEGRWWTLLTSVFSHNMFLHFFLNMFVLNSFGSLLEIVMGRRFFILFYIGAGIISSLAHALVSAFILGEPSLPALGASGAISGLILIFSLMFPKERILIFGIIPVPAMWGALLFIGLDLWGLFEQSQGSGLPIGHGAHLGGAVTGILTYIFWIRPRAQRVRREDSPQF